MMELFAQKLNSLNTKVYLAPGETNGFLDLFQKSVNRIELLEYQHEFFLLRDIFKNDTKIQSVLYFPSIFPLWDLEVSARVISNHTSYLADYSYGENLPPGICPPVFGRSLIEVFETEHEEIAHERDFPVGLCGYIEKNINDFHVEIHYEEPDLRMLRLDFSIRNFRSLIKANRVLTKLVPEKPSYQQLEPLMEKHPEILYTSPSYLEVELIQDCEYKCIFCPRQYLELEPHIMGDAVLEKIESHLNHSLGDASICFGGLGEPLQHPEIENIVPRFLGNSFLRFLVVETNGYHLDKILSVTEDTNFEKMRLVVNVNGFKNYGSIHGVNPSYLERVKKNLEAFVEKARERGEVHLEAIHIQMLKINETQEEIDEVEEFSQKLGVCFLLQKYNSYVGLMPERRVSDMTPLERSPCWHLRRDLFIRANGDVAFCKQDLENKNVSGNLNDISINEIWESRQAHWIKHFQGDHSAYPACKSCDEYFTFNL